MPVRAVVAVITSTDAGPCMYLGARGGEGRVGKGVRHAPAATRGMPLAHGNSRIGTPGVEMGVLLAQASGA